AELWVGSASVRRWAAPGAELVVRDWVEASFPLGADDAAHSKLKFSWPSETGAPPAQADVLLQIFVDQLASALERTGSEYAPRPRVSAPDVTDGRGVQP